jgi:hypothetical protein
VCSDQRRHQPQRKKIALLSSSHAWIFSDFKKDAFFGGKYSESILAITRIKKGFALSATANYT